MLDTVIFDVDGTLVDSERDGHRVAFNDAFVEHGVPYQWDEQEYGRLLAVAGGRRRLEAFLRDEGHPEAEAVQLAATLHAAKTQRFTELIANGVVPPRPGVLRLLDELQAAGITLAVATTGSRAWVEPLLDRSFGGQERFAAVVTGDDVAALKPAADAYLAALDLMGAEPTTTVAVEDSSNGFVAARAASLPCLVVVNDYTRDEDFDGAGLVVDAFGGPGSCQVLGGSEALLEDGRVCLATLQAISAAGASS